ncbi:pseudouridine synthase [Hymenobacter fastidiosus]|uniref:Pseudouridine synthase n=2 Tax=Hymenobacter fastidiosus TaxID=486264 RepID=A0ABP7RII2_9BACT
MTEISNMAPREADVVHRHFLVHKPFGYLSQFVADLKKKKLLGELHDFPAGTMAIGRLDEHSEGLLLLTTDGRVSERVRSKKVEKEYYAQVDGLITDEAVARLQQGVEIGIRDVKYQTLPCRACRLDPAPDFPARTRKIRDDRHGPTSWVSITLTEGKNRQIRKMTAAAGFPTLRLLRVRVGTVHLGELAAGEVREVTIFSLPT